MSIGGGLCAELDWERFWVDGVDPRDLWAEIEQRGAGSTQAGAQSAQEEEEEKEPPEEGGGTGRPGGGAAAAEQAEEESPQEGFHCIWCLPSGESPDPRARIDAELEVLSECLREEPTVPADPEDQTQPWAAALLEDAAVQLPKKHCAFSGCGRHLSNEAERLGHLALCHAPAVDRVAELLPKMYSVEERRAAAYNEAIATRVRKGAPTALYSIDRRCLYNYAQAATWEAVQAPICFLCACVHPWLRARERNEIRWKRAFWEARENSPENLLGLDRERAAELLGLDRFLQRYGRCEGAVPDLTQHFQEFED